MFWGWGDLFTRTIQTADTKRASCSSAYAAAQGSTRSVSRIITNQRQARTCTAGCPSEAAAINSNGRRWDGGSLSGAQPCLDDATSHIVETLGCGKLSAHLFIWWSLVHFDHLSLSPSSTSLIQTYSWSTQPLLWKRQRFTWCRKSQVWNIFLIFCWVVVFFFFLVIESQTNSITNFICTVFSVWRRLVTMFTAA